MVDFRKIQAYLQPKDLLDRVEGSDKRTRTDVYVEEFGNASDGFTRVRDDFIEYRQNQTLLNRHECVRSIIEHFGLEESEHEKLMAGEPFELSEFDQTYPGRIIVEVKRNYDPDL